MFENVVESGIKNICERWKKYFCYWNFYTTILFHSYIRFYFIFIFLLFVTKRKNVHTSKLITYLLKCRAHSFIIIFKNEQLIKKLISKKLFF